MSYDFDFTEPGYTPGSYDFDFLPPFYTYHRLAGASNNFTAVWAAPDAGLFNGRLYIASPAAFSVISDTILVDYYTSTRAGRTGDTLDQEDIIDINV